MNTLLKVLCVDEYYKSLLGWEEESQSIKLNQIYIKSFTVKIHFCPYLFFFLSLPFNPSDKQRSPRLMHREAPAAIKAFLKFLVLDSKLMPTWAELSSWSCWMQSLLLWGCTYLVYPLCKKEIKHTICLTREKSGVGIQNEMNSNNNESCWERSLRKMYPHLCLKQSQKKMEKV